MILIKHIKNEKIRKYICYITSVRGRREIYYLYINFYYIILSRERERERDIVVLGFSSQNVPRNLSLQRNVGDLEHPV